jgi:hypothetical protein
LELKDQIPDANVVAGLGPGFEQGTIDSNAGQPLGSHTGRGRHGEVGEGDGSARRLTFDHPHVALSSDVEINRHRAVEDETGPVGRRL